MMLMPGLHVGVGDLNSCPHDRSGAAKAGPQGKLKAVGTYLKIPGMSQINNLMMGLKTLEIQEDNKPKCRQQQSLVQVKD